MTSPILVGYPDWGRQESESQVLEINDNNVTKSASVFYPIRPVTNAKALMVWMNPTTLPVRAGLRFYGDANGIFIMDEYQIDCQVNNVARQPVPILGPYMDAFIEPQGAGSYNYTFQVWRIPTAGYFAGPNIEKALFSQVIQSIAASTTVTLINNQVMESEIYWTVQMSGGNWITKLAARDITGADTPIDYVDSGGSVLGQRKCYAPPMTIVALVQNLSTAVQSYTLVATRGFNR